MTSSVSTAPKKYHIRYFDFFMAVFAIMLSAYGVVIIGSAREALQNRQMYALIVGVAAMVAISFVDYSFILKFYWFYYAAGILLLLAVRLFGRKVGGAKRWLIIAGVQFQPSEVVKFLLILFFAAFIMKNRDKMNKPSFAALCAVLTFPAWYLIYKQPDMSTSIVVLMIFCMMMFVGGIGWKIVAGVLAITVPLVLIFMMMVLQPDQELIQDYQQNRILAWLQPDKYSSTEGYQQQNSQIAIGSGRLTGKGYKNNEVGSVKNGNFIAEPQTDFIFAIVGEELGFLGGMVIVGLAFLLVVEIIRLGWRARDLSGTLICAGVATHIGFQVFLNIAVTTGLMPNTGIPLPFVSYGMTSLISLFMELGVVLNVGLLRKRDRGSEL
ncbi:MAG: rod shape-determining protein RodA [Lachnospiraceae bacterium]|nr:rod shape-determining protein RodA [Lachnospiraceae bacterium]